MLKHSSELFIIEKNNGDKPFFLPLTSAFASIKLLITFVELFCTDKTNDVLQLKSLQ